MFSRITHTTFLFDTYQFPCDTRQFLWNMKLFSLAFRSLIRVRLWVILRRVLDIHVFGTDTFSGEARTFVLFFLFNDRSRRRCINRA